MFISVVKSSGLTRFTAIGRNVIKWAGVQRESVMHCEMRKIYSQPFTAATAVILQGPCCPLCMTHSNFHSSALTCKKKTYTKPVVYSPKSKKKPETIIQVWRNMTVSELAKALDKDIDHVFEVMLFVDDSIQYDTPTAIIDNAAVITDIVKKSGVRCTWIANLAEESKLKASKDATRRPLPDDPRSLVKRPPVVTVMGHVDHGKTTLLDSLRNTSVVSQEFGGITQHIGAFQVRLASGEMVTFLDTPGHAAFMAMRARGAHVTDIVVLVVAADDGVMDQTVECIRLANEANVPMIVAINKIDKPQADIEQCKRGLLQRGILLEDTGGEIQSVPVSALEGTNLDALVEAITTQAELMHLKADLKGFVEGYVVESKTDHARGKLSTSIINRGTLRKGAFLVAGTAWAKVRAMFDDKGHPMPEAPPSTPVEIVGWRELPSAGDELLEVESEKRARDVIAYRLQCKKEKKMEDDSVIVRMKAEEHLKVYREELAKRRASGRFKSRRPVKREKEIKDDDGSPRLAIVLNGDVDGSVEAILDVFDTYQSRKCQLDVVHYSVGMVSENDVELCSAFKGVIYSFNVGMHPNATKLASELNVPIKEFNVIYRLIEDVKEEIDRRLPMIDQDEILGEADVLQEFVINDGKHKIPVAGSRCIKGTLKKSALFRLVRGTETIHENGRLSSMRHLKTEVDSIKKDVECGLKFEDREVRFQPGDRIICYQKIAVSQKTDWDPGF